LRSTPFLKIVKQVGEGGALAEIYKNDLDRKVSLPASGLYLTKIKKDPLTGNFVGVATFFSKSQPLPGNLIVPSRTESRSNPIENAIEASRVSPEVVDNPVLNDQYYARADYFKSFDKLLSVERRPTQSTMFDPYDAYEL
jgi:hypothetical protein